MGKRSDISRGDEPVRLTEEQVGRLRVDLLAMLRRHTRDPALAEDLAQEALLHVVRGLSSWRASAALRTWARRIALNVLHDHLRRQATSPVERVIQGDGFSVDGLLDDLQPAPAAPPPDETADRRATHDCLLDAARRLPLAERTIILLHDFGDVPFERAAAACGCSVSTARVRLHRARRQLAEICRGSCRSESGSDGATLCTPQLPEEFQPGRAARRRAAHRTRR